MHIDKDTFDKYDEPRLHMERLLRESIVSIELPARVAFPLDDVGIRRVKDLVSQSEKSLMKIPRINVKSVSIIKNCLHHLGLSLSK